MPVDLIGSRWTLMKVTKDKSVVEFGLFLSTNFIDLKLRFNFDKIRNEADFLFIAFLLILAY